MDGAISTNSNWIVPATIGHRRSAALVRHVRHLDAQHAAQQFGVEMMECTDPAGTVIEPPLLSDLDEVGDAVHRQRWIDHQDKRDAGHQRDRHQILARLVRQFLEDRGVYRHRTAGRLHERVAVGCSLGGGGGSNSGAGTGAVLDDECLTQPLLQLVRNRARDQIGAATRSERHEDRDAVRRIILTSRMPRPCERDNADDDAPQYDIHRLPSLFASAARCGR